ncbi:M3 family oligoendopeptidase [Anaerocolumna xylanovorans]|uniref:Oligoendopeptidase, M3 family n=1 Tax=Anaerocolumna xylanovorans DSM 12503 TaxID=1121345 RepID=A0A1M7YNI7_9FIRM|nr:M3 family oligoendopeptidase [Anaerocolumna xylanovorans]SHO54202.1 oligoendopeptidase, M3 family [Anaerocolumna xylanovorans DSM 12503]
MKFNDIPYERVDMEEVRKSFNELIKEQSAAKSGEEQFEIHKKAYRLIDKVLTQMVLCEIRHSGNTTDEFYEKENDYYDEKKPEYEELRLKYYKVLLESPYRSFMEEKIGKVAFKNIELKLRSLDEKLIPLMQEENNLISTYHKLIAGAKINFNGEELNISLLRKYLTDSDRNVRKEAWSKLSAFFTESSRELDDIYDKMVKNRTAQAKLMGYENYVELGYCRMNRNSYDKDMVKNFRDQVKKVLVPLATKVHELRREALGLDSLKFYDNEMYFNNGNPAPIGTPEEILMWGKEMYSDLSPETKEFFEFMYENELFDVMGRKNKQAGGYMTFLPDYKAPFIFANFNGTSSDVDVITHECGHAFQGYVARNYEIEEHMDITMETAEIHSMSMEFFTDRYMEKFFGDRAEDYRKMHLNDSIVFIPYGCMVDEFQHIVYENPDMTPDERKDAWMKLESEYRPHMDYADDSFFSKGGFWQRQLHIYAAPFYYIDYCLAQTCALQYRIKMDKDYKKAWESYLELCKLSAKEFYEPMLNKVGLDSPFQDGCMKNIVEELTKTYFNK